MRPLAFLLSLATLAPLFAQRMDTVSVEDPRFRYIVTRRNKQGDAVGPVAYYGHDSVLYCTMEFKDRELHGTAIYYYPGGRKKVEMPYKNGELHGVIRTYHPNGAVEWVKPYKHGKLFGERMLRDTTGAPVTGDYVDHLPYDEATVESHCVKGRPEGKVVVSHFGRTNHIGNYVHGLAEGDFIFYDEHEKPVRKDSYKKGRFVASEELTK